MILHARPRGVAVDVSLVGENCVQLSFQMVNTALKSQSAISLICCNPGGGNSCGGDEETSTPIDIRVISIHVLSNADKKHQWQFWGQELSWENNRYRNPDPAPFHDVIKNIPAK